jgi:hypothetical protein
MSTLNLHLVGNGPTRSMVLQTPEEPAMQQVIGLMRLLGATIPSAEMLADDLRAAQEDLGGVGVDLWIARVVCDEDRLSSILWVSSIEDGPDPEAALREEIVRWVGDGHRLAG